MNSVTRFTIFGHKGFIGSNVVKYLEKKNVEVVLPERNIIPDGDLGHVVYCVGLTADFRVRLFDTVDAHVSYLTHLLRKIKFTSFLYLSSTRVYAGLPTNQLADEDSKILVQVQNPSDVYRLSKLLGESICLSTENQKVRIMRLSNVYGKNMGPDSFLGNVIEQAKKRRKVIIGQAKDTRKDYVFIGDVEKLIYKISVSGKLRLYNIATQEQFSHEDVAAVLENMKIPVVVGMEAGPVFPVISNQRVVEEFGYRFVSCRDKLEEIFRESIARDREIL